MNGQRLPARRHKWSYVMMIENVYDMGPPSTRISKVLHMGSTSPKGICARSVRLYRLYEQKQQRSLSRVLNFPLEVRASAIGFLLTIVELWFWATVGALGNFVHIRISGTFGSLDPADDMPWDLTCCECAFRKG